MVSKAVLIHGLIPMSKTLVTTRIPEMSEATLGVVMGVEVVQVVHVVSVVLTVEVVEVVTVSLTKMLLIMLVIGVMTSHRPMSGTTKSILVH